MLTDETVTIKQLLLDPNNLRLDYDIVQDEIPELCFLNVQEETLDKLENENIDDLRESILSNGFIEVDRIVVREAKELTKNISRATHTMLSLRAIDEQQHLWAYTMTIETD